MTGARVAAADGQRGAAIDRAGAVRGDPGAAIDDAMASGGARPRLLLVVSPGRLQFYRQLARSLSGCDHVEAILDRRTGDRRLSPRTYPLERRCRERRAARADEQLEAHGWFMAWRDPPPARPRLPDAPALVRPAARVGPGLAVAPAEAETAHASEPPDLAVPGASGLEPIGETLAPAPGSSVAEPDWAAPDSGPGRAFASRRMRLTLAVLLVTVAFAAAAYMAVELAPGRAREPAPPARSATAIAGAPAAPAARAGAPSSRAGAPAAHESPPIAGDGSTAAPGGVLARRAAIRREIRDAFRGWVDSTNRRQLAAHMAWYADPVAVFYNRRGVPKRAVEALRARTFTEATRVDVRTSDPEIRVARDEQSATMVFRKSYELAGPRMERRGTVIQELSWKRTGTGWRIVGERTLDEPAADIPALPPRP